MKQNREHGKKKLATGILSFILALVFVFSIFSGIASAECKIIDEKVLDTKFHPTGTPEVEKQCKFISSTCEESIWKRTIITTKKVNLEKIMERTYACKCEGTGKWETEPTPRIETEWVRNVPRKDPPKIDYLTGGATCPKPCVTQEQFDAAVKNVKYWEYMVVVLEAQLYTVGILGAKMVILNPLLAPLAAAIVFHAQKNLDNAKSSRDAAHEKFNELCKLPSCYPKPQRPGGCD